MLNQAKKALFCSTNSSSQMSSPKVLNTFYKKEQQMASGSSETFETRFYIVCLFIVYALDVKKKKD